MQRIDHPNVMPVVVQHVSHEPPYFVMPLAKHSLEAEIPRLSASEPDALAAFADICCGMQAIHGSGSVHRDVKPSNVLRLHDERLVVGDLGLAKFQQRDTAVLTNRHQVLGTDAYAAPEQRLPDGSRSADVRTDIYQLGKTLYHLLSGLSPAVLEFNRVTPGLRHIIRKCTHEDPGDRYQSVGQVLDAINLYMAATKPDADAIALFQAELPRVRDRLKRAAITPDDCVRLLGLLMAVDEAHNDSFAVMLESCEDGLLSELCAKCSRDMYEVVRRYLVYINKTLAQRTFEYADTVSRVLRVVFAASTNTECQVLALQGVLIVAVDKNRYASMDCFDAMLKTVRDDALASQIAEMLKHHEQRYRGLANRVPGVHLHKCIRHVRDGLVRQQGASR